MATIQEFYVIQPPTNAEVKKRALRAFVGETTLDLILLGEQEVPAPEEQPISFSIVRTLHLPDGGLNIAGETEDGNSVTVRIGVIATEPATASVVTA